ncbi:hypothetical protein ACR3K2_25250 [Cryptosporidium serpentis]
METRIKFELPIFCLRDQCKDAISSLEFISKTQLLCGTVKGEIRLWDLEKRIITSNNNKLKAKIIQTFTDIEKESLSLVIQTNNGLVSKYTLNNSPSLQNLNLSKQWEIQKITFSKISRWNNSSNLLLIPGKEQYNFAIIDIEKPKLEETLVLFKGCESFGSSLGILMSMQQTSEHNFIAGYESGAILEWDARNPGNPLDSNCIVPSKSPIVSISRAYNRIWISDYSNNLYVYNRKDFKIPINTLNLAYSIDNIETRADSMITIASSSSNGVMDLYENKSLKHLGKLKWHKKKISSTVFCHFTGRFASSDDTLIAIWDLFQDKFII